MLDEEAEEIKIRVWENEGKVRGKVAYPSKERFIMLKKLASQKGVDFNEPC